MKWHKHMSDMVDDPRIRRLIKRFGADGYAVYNLILERVTKGMSTESPVPDLEETAEDIADLLRMDTVRVEEIVWYCMGETGLFEQDEITGRILVGKIYKFIQQSETRSNEIRRMIAAYNSVSETVSDGQRLSERNVKELEQNRTRTEERKSAARATHPTLSVPVNQTRYDNLCSEHGQKLVDWAIQSRLDWESANGKRAAKDYAAAAANWIQRAREFGKMPNLDGGDGLRPYRAGDPL